MASTLSRFADFFSSSAAGIPLGSYVENEIEAGCDAARCFRYSHHQIEAVGQNWHPSWMEGVRYQTQVNKILWEQFCAHAERRI
jgi:hypothetical protein